MDLGIYVDGTIVDWQLIEKKKGRLILVHNIVFWFGLGGIVIQYYDEEISRSQSALRSPGCGVGGRGSAAGGKSSRP